MSFAIPPRGAYNINMRNNYFQKDLSIYFQPLNRSTMAKDISKLPTPPLPGFKQTNLLKSSIFGDIRRQNWNVCQVIARQYYAADLPQEILYKEIKHLSKRIIKLKQWNPQSKNSLWN